MILRVDVLVLTYKRPEWLAGTLRSVAEQRLENDIQMGIIVVDNDAAESARAIVSRFQRTFPDVRYVCEPQPNIANARNRALREASANLVAFIDDDEVAEPQWLQRLIDAQRHYGASIVLGPVVPVLPENAPRWAIKGRFFDRPRFATGSYVSSGGTGNVLLNLATVRGANVQFDSNYGVSGGEDTWFFHQLRTAGQRLIWCDEAVAHEHVPPSRLRIGWLMRRAFSSGCGHARMFYRERNLASRTMRVILHVLMFAGSLLFVPIAAGRGSPGAIRTVLYSMRNLGRGVGLWYVRPAVAQNSEGVAARAL